MAKVVDPRYLPELKVGISGLKPPVRDFVPADPTDPSEADAFNRLVRELRDHRLESPRG